MGEFGVELPVHADGPQLPVLVPLPDAGLGDLVECGLPFYWGSVGYETTCEPPVEASLPRWLDCGRADGVVTLRVNGIDIGSRYMAPYRFYIGDAVRPGSNRIELTLGNTAQNLFGPHRGPGRDALETVVRRSTGPGAYFLCPFGIHGPIKISPSTVG